jgi:hypothetical protein
LYRAACVCVPGASSGDAGCVTVIGAPRPVAPLSTSTVTARSPTLRWVLAPGTDGASVDLCADRACTSPLTFSATGSSAVVPALLAPGVHYWRLRGSSAGTVGTATSPVWEFFVGARAAPTDTSWGTVPDVNGDGYADVVIGYVNSGGFGDIDVYAGGAGGVSPTAATVHGATTGFGLWGVYSVSLAGAGDVNGDGFADVVIGLMSFNSNADVGAVNVALGGPQGLASAEVNVFAEAVPGYAGARPTIGVAAAGDVNGDGYADVITNGAYDKGFVSVLLGSANGLSTVPITLASPAGTTGGFAFGIAGAGDVNGDGYGDVVVTSGGSLGVLLYLGGPGGPTGSPIALGTGGPPLAGAGDVNGDGLADFLAGSVVFYGDRRAGSAASAVLTKPSDSGPYDRFGAWVDTAGDVDGDGYADLIIGSPDSYGGGHAYVYRGGASGPLSILWALDGPGSFASEVAGAGDVNGDGHADVLVGTPVRSIRSSPAGAVDLYLGTASSSVAPATVLAPYSTYGFE